MSKPFSKLALLSPLATFVGIGIAAYAVLAYRSGEMHFVTAIDTFTWGAYVAIAALLLSLTALWLTRPGAYRRGLLAALTSLVFAIPLVYAAFMFEYTARIYPPINDISTDLEDPPSFWEIENPRTYPGGEVAEMQTQAYPDLAPLQLGLESTQVFRLAEQLAVDFGWEIIAADESDMQIEAVAYSFLFGFSDNVVIRIMDEGDTSRVDMRSYSQLGRIDRGANAKRIQRYLQALQDLVTE